MINLLYSIAHLKCPRCHKGDVFQDRNAYHLRKLALMHEACRYCGQKFTPETGFYLGATYVSYAFSVALVVLVAGILYLCWGADFPIGLLAILAGALSIILTPLIIRYSRIIWLNIFVHYDPDA
jgi:uncharacterized protein (DUF983 family)